MRLLLSIFVILFCINVNAQELTVKSFTEQTNDLTARSNPREDLNGNPCALVKVRMAVDNATFKGMVIGNVDYRNGEYYVYMPEGAKKLSVSAPNYLVLDVKFEDYGVGALGGKTTYQLTLSSNVNENPSKQIDRAQTGWIVLNSEPNDADVYLNDEYVGRTPLVNCKKAYGHYKYKIEKNNYHSGEGEFDLITAKYQNTIQLKPAFGSVNIKSSVSDITIFLDGQQVSQTASCVLERIASGSHSITIQKEKYAPFKQTIVVKDGEEALVNANMLARFSNVTITSLAGAQIYINGTLKGSSSYKEDLMEGFYDVEVKKEHHISVTKQIEVKAGVNQVVKLEPTPILCTLDVVSLPVDASVNIDGIDYGTTPCTIDNLLEGEHIIKVLLDKYQIVKQEIILKPNEDNIVTFQLEEKKEFPIVQMDENLRPKEEEGDEGQIFEVVEQQPAFPGGMEKLMQWLDRNLKYPKSAQENGTQGRVVCQFIINKDGSVVEPKVIKSVDPALDREAIRVISSMPKWTPGKENGKAVRVRFALPVTFRLVEDTTKESTYKVPFDTLIENANSEVRSCYYHAKSGDAEAQCKLGIYFLFGQEGLPKNTHYALDWLVRSAAQKNKQAKHILKEFKYLWKEK